MFPILEQPLIPPLLSPSQLQTIPIWPPSNFSAPQQNNLNVSPPQTSPSRSSYDEHVSEGTTKGKFDFEPENTSLESSPIIQSSYPFVYGPDFDESRINLIVKYPKVQKPSSSNLGKVLT